MRTKLIPSVDFSSKIFWQSYIVGTASNVAAAESLEAMLDVPLQPVEKLVTFLVFIN